MRDFVQTDTSLTTRRVAMARSWLRIRAMRNEMLDPALFADPAWDLLLDLYVQHHLGRPVTVSSACIAAKVPATTGLRWIRSLVQRGWLVRGEDPHDRRSNRVTLTEATLGKLDRLFDAAFVEGVWSERSAA